MRYFSLILATLLSLSLAACEGPAGADGADGLPGPSGDAGPPGPAGDAGEQGRSPTFAEEGLKLVITGAAITGTVATVDFTIHGEDDTPLDVNGEFTPGAVDARFVLARVTDLGGGEAGPYEAYTTREATGVVSGTVTQAHYDNTGTFEELAPGSYRYTLATAVTQVDASETLTVAAFATRTIDDERAISNSTYDFVADGSGSPVTREVVDEASCNGCHQQISAHGGSRQDLTLCLTCHSPQTVDPDSGNSVDFRDMLHRIHMGAELPTVQAGVPYQIIGYMGSVHDYSDVHFPQSNESCVTCHQGADADAHLNRPKRDVCGSCHDSWFGTAGTGPTGYVDHTGGPQADDSSCTSCHPASGGAAGVEDSHLLPTEDPANGEIVAEILAVTNNGPGLAPVVDFRVTIGGIGEDILGMTTTVNRLRAVIAGPNTDYESYAYVSDMTDLAQGTLTEIDAMAGEFRFAFDASYALDPGATGSFSVGLEIRYAAVGGNIPAYAPVAAFAVTDAVAIERHLVVDGVNCNSCHLQLAEHGGSRTNPNYCVMCHIPSNANDERASRYELDPSDGVTPYTAVIETVDFKQMIHRIHMGEELTQPYVLGGYPPPNDGSGMDPADPVGSPIDFGHVRFPGERADCTTCHVGETYTLPIADGSNREATRLEVRLCTEPPGDDADDYCHDPFWTVDELIEQRPERAACTGCHDAPYTDAHTVIMTAPSGDESCATCHGEDASWSVSSVHGL